MRHPFETISNSFVLACLFVLGTSFVFGQSKPAKNPLAQPTPVEAANKIKITYLTRKKRGAPVKLYMASGAVISGKIMMRREQEGVLMILLPDGKTHRFVKETHIESCE